MLEWLGFLSMAASPANPVLGLAQKKFVESLGGTLVMMVDLMLHLGSKWIIQELRCVTSEMFQW
jgi:hypothetical protein